jgi:signal transduction histidine kinase
LKGLLDFLMHKGLFDGYRYVLVPQLGKDQGRKISFSRFRKSVPQSVYSACSEIIDEHNIDLASSRVFRRTRTPHDGPTYSLTYSSIASAYNINIGAICLASKGKLFRRDLAFILNAFEALISLRKKAVALRYHGEFLQLDMNERRSLDRAVGDIVHKAVNPHETIIFALDESRSRYEATYSSGKVALSLPQGGKDPLGHCFRQRELVVINDTNDRANIIKTFGSDFAIREFLNFNHYSSCILVPVNGATKCYCVVACFFARKNAVSSTETEVLALTCRILGDYYRLWTERNELQYKIKENDRITALVRQALLIADIMHDASEDLVTARAQIGTIQARTDLERAALTAAKDSLKELINASRQFRLFFSRRTKEGAAPERAIAHIKTVTSGNNSDNVNVHDLVEEIKTKYKQALESNKIILRNACSNTFEFSGFKYNIKRAIDNAIRNSIAHLRDKSHVRREITISHRHLEAGANAKLPSEHVEIIIADNGRGVEPEHLHDVTKPFFSLRGGMGLGLSIIEAACEAQGGRLQIASEWGKDFRVTMSIPVVPQISD